MFEQKTITFYVDRPPIYEGTKDALYYYAHTSTQHAIEESIPEIHTSSLVDLSFSLLDKGYKIFVVKNGIKKEFYPGMDNCHNKDIRREHNVMKLLISGFFDNDFVE